MRPLGCRLVAGHCSEYWLLIRECCFLKMLMMLHRKWWTLEKDEGRSGDAEIFCFREVDEVSLLIVADLRCDAFFYKTLLITGHFWIELSWVELNWLSSPETSSVRFYILFFLTQWPNTEGTSSRVTQVYCEKTLTFKSNLRVPLLPTFSFPFLSAPVKSTEGKTELLGRNDRRRFLAVNHRWNVKCVCVCVCIRYCLSPVTFLRFWCTRNWVIVEGIRRRCPETLLNALAHSRLFAEAALDSGHFRLLFLVCPQCFAVFLSP